MDKVIIALSSCNSKSKSWYSCCTGLCYLPPCWNRMLHWL